MEQTDMSKRNSKYALFVVAHPDDETLFFGSTIRRSPIPTQVICVTDGNADGQGAKRSLDFNHACRKLRVKSALILGLPDIFTKRLEQTKIIEFLKGLPQPHIIYTHGPLGEYGHPHHQDVCRAVHEAFPSHKRLYGVAFNAKADITLQLSPADFQLKAQIYSKIYFEETKRFINMVPINHAEAFCRYRLREVRAIHDFLSQDGDLNEKHLDRLKWYKPYLEFLKKASQARPF